MPKPANPPANGNLPRLRALLVDDAPSVLQGLRQLLELAGGIQVVATAETGPQAIRLAAEHSPDVVVMDLEMPGMDGCEAARQIKASGLARRVIMLSVHGTPQAMQRARNAGADGYVVKGESVEILIAAILGRDGDSVHPDV